MKNRVIAILLLLGVCSTAPACGDDAVSVDTTGGETSAETEELDPRVTIDDELPDVNFNGETFTVLTYEWRLADIYVEELDGEVVNDAIYESRMAVSDRFNVNIEGITQEDYTAVESYISRSVLSQDNSFQLAAQHVVSLGISAMSDLFMNWYDVPHIDFSKPWWSSSMHNDLTYGGDVAMVAVGDYSLSSLDCTYCVFFDKQDVEEYGLENLYEVVWRGDWTLDYLGEITRNMYVDVNGDAIRDGGDYYGLTQNMKTALNAYLWSCGGKIIEMDEDGLPSLEFYNERMVDVVSKLYRLFYESEGTVTDRSDNPNYSDVWNIDTNSFNDHLTTFITQMLGKADSAFREREGEYGILPLPKYDASQDGYYTMVDGGHTALAIPKTITDPEFVGIITEALNAESYRKVYPHTTRLRSKPNTRTTMNRCVCSI